MSDSNSSSDVPVKETKPKKTKKVKTMESDEEEAKPVRQSGKKVDSDSEEEEKPKKGVKKDAKSNAKKGKKRAASPDEEDVEDIDDNGDFSIDLGNKRHVRINEFKGRHFVDIREMYEKDGKVLPGKKGISLNLDQWRNLVKNVGKISKAIDSL